MIVMTIEQLAERLQGANLTQLSKATNLHVNTLRNIRDRKSVDTKFSTMLTLQFHFNKVDKEAAE